MILMDYMMPLMDGIEATKKIRDIEKNQPSHSRTPIIAVSGKLTDDVKTSLISAGVDDFIAKPFSAKTLAGIIDTFTSH